MRIALVNQPLGHLLLPRPGRPLRSSSIGLWHYHVATRLAEENEVFVYGRSTLESQPEEESCRGVRFRGVPVDRDERRLQLQGRLRALGRRIGLAGDPRRPYFLSAAYYAHYVTEVARQLRRDEVDIVHLANFSQFAPLIRRLHPRARIVLHMHCEWLTHLDGREVAKNLAACDRISACSDYLVKNIRERFPHLAERCYALPNGVDLETFRPPAAPAGGTEILFISRISPEKGVHLLIAAFPRILERIPGARLLLVGSQVPAPAEFIVGVDPDPQVRALARFYQGGESYLAQLRKMLPAGCAKRVSFLPRMPQPELLSLYQAAAVFVFPSVCQEAFGMPPAEAMACGLPVIASRSGGLPEVVEEGRTGLLVPRGDASALAEAVAALLADPARRRAMGEAGRQRAERFFSWDRVACLLRERLQEW